MQLVNLETPRGRNKQYSPTTTTKAWQVLATGLCFIFEVYETVLYSYETYGSFSYKIPPLLLSLGH